MKKIFPQTDEFYIGYLPSSPNMISSFIKWVIPLMLTFSLIIAIVLCLGQRDFATSEFEYGVETSLSGILMKSPVPHLRISLGKNSQGQELFQTVLLVGSGKCGLDEEIQKFALKTSVIIKGFLIYGDGKALLQVNDVKDILPNDKILVSDATPRQAVSDKNYTSVTGEVTDPKCYFGVMKPGEGKPHRSCAIRCIAGGIPAVFKTNSSDYFLLLNENMQSLNSDVLSIVGDQVNLDGEIIELDDWRILKVASKRINAIARSLQQKKRLLAIESEMTFCSHPK